MGHHYVISGKYQKLDKNSQFVLEFSVFLIHDTFNQYNGISYKTQIHIGQYKPLLGPLRDGPTFECILVEKKGPDSCQRNFKLTESKFSRRGKDLNLLSSAAGHFRYVRLFKAFKIRIEIIVSRSVFSGKKCFDLHFRRATVVVIIDVLKM